MNRNFSPKIVGTFAAVLILLCLAGIATAATEAVVIPGTWDLYSGTSRIGSDRTEAECIERAKKAAGKYGCRTITHVEVVVKPDPPVPPVPVPEPPKPEPPKPVGMDAIKANAAPTTPNSLKSLTGNQSLSKAGQVLEGFELRGGQITVTAPNVRIRNFRIVGDMKVPYGIVATDSRVSDLLVEAGDITGVTNIGIYGHDMTIRRVAVRESGADGFRPTGNSTLEENYCEKLGRPGAHADCVQVLIGKNLVFRRNYFYLPFNDPNWMNSAGYMIQADKGPVDNVLIEDGWCIGGDFCIQLTGGVTNARVRNMTLGREGHEAEYGPWADNVVNATGNKPDTLCGNVYTDGKPVVVELKDKPIPGNPKCQ